ncbi:MAG: GNAT family N-acetyltransferase [Candidatus Sungbacteria bacterium]|uniref:GNAT family N-acetyltransferase n=1 Tax=Candidatus Sungiibacteriota bacterium TaxID=2750080 RepID=A0A931WNV9_9BACT|nr:GNAT family N-acetyltransferase [Candidatus Sungbacteria bacterium]
MPIIRTKHVLIRPFNNGDEFSLAKNINDPIISRNTLTIPYPYRLKDARDWIGLTKREWLKKNSPKMNWAIDINGEVVGGVGLHFQLPHKAEVGYWLARKCWRRGIMTEVVGAVTEYGFKKLKLRRIFAFTFPFNKASQGVLKRSGFKYEGLLRKNVKKGKTYHDDLLFAKVK